MTTEAQELIEGQQNKPVPDPNLYDAMMELKLDIFRSLHAIKLGQIQSFDGTKKTAVVQVLFQRVLPDNSTIEYPVLVDVPVFTLQGGGGAIYAPIAAGDQCLLLFGDRNIDAWFANGGVAPPYDARCHSLADGIAIVGVNSLASTLAAYPAGKFAMVYQSAEFSITATELKAQRGDGKLSLVDDKAQLIKNLAELTALETNLIRIKNGTTDLLTLLINFITLLEGINVLDDEGGAILPLTPAFIALLEAYKLQFQTLLST